MTSIGAAQKRLKPSKAMDAQPKPRRAFGPKVCEPQAQAAIDSITNTASKAAAPSMPTC